MVEIHILVHEMLDEGGLFGGELVGALTSLNIGALNVFEYER
jgi:hypothetical protein